MKRALLLAAIAAVALWAGPALAGEYHVGGTLLCYDCHTMHFSMQHGFDGGTVGNTAVVGGNWLSSTGPNTYLLKAPANQLCLQCHDGKGFAPDVLGANSGIAPAGLRQAGALNETGLSGYQTWMGHTLDSTDTPPGWNPTLVGLGNSPVYTPSNGLECTSCHLQHGTTTAYRNLGWRKADFTPSYTIGANAPAAGGADVWVNITKGWTTGAAAPNTPEYYSLEKVFFNRSDTLADIGTLSTSNRVGSVCAACHAGFHGGVGNSTVGGTPVGTGGGQEFQRHPTAKTTIGQAGGGHSGLTQYTNATNRVKVWANYTGDPSAGANITNPGPACISCHKAHGNQNPFGLIFMGRSTGSVSEEGTTTDVAIGMRNLCGQCHRQGNS